MDGKYKKVAHNFAYFNSESTVIIFLRLLAIPYDNSLIKFISTSLAEITSIQLLISYKEP